VQSASEQVIGRRRDGHGLAETRRSRVQQAEGSYAGAQQYGSTANGSEGDIRQDEESDGNLPDVPAVKALSIKYEVYPLRITKVVNMTGPIIKDKDVSCQREAAEQ
jgi:hypothetical protein